MRIHLIISGLYSLHGRTYGEKTASPVEAVRFTDSKGRPFLLSDLDGEDPGRPMTSFSVSDGFAQYMDNVYCTTGATLPSMDIPEGLFEGATFQGVFLKREAGLATEFSVSEVAVYVGGQRKYTFSSAESKKAVLIA